MNKEQHTPILSLCIPTNGAMKWIVPVIESIYAQGCDESLYEIIVSDNAKNPELQQYVQSLHHSNIIYQQSDAEGFLNIVSSFQNARGEFCKLINHRAIIHDGWIMKLTNVIRNNISKKPVIFCTNGVLGNVPEFIHCKDIDSLVYNLHYFCTWMGGLGIWRKDVSNLDNITFNKMFPNTSILFEQRQEQSEYLLWNTPFFQEQNGHGKGCYNLFHTFAVVFPEILLDLQSRGRITNSTYKKVMKDLYECLTIFYMTFALRDPDSSFDLSHTHKYITKYYSQMDYMKLIYKCHKEYYKPILIRKLHNFFNIFYHNG